MILPLGSSRSRWHRLSQRVIRSIISALLTVLREAFSPSGWSESQPWSSLYDGKTPLPSSRACRRSSCHVNLSRGERLRASSRRFGTLCCGLPRNSSLSSLFIQQLLLSPLAQQVPDDRQRQIVFAGHRHHGGQRFG